MYREELGRQSLRQGAGSFRDFCETIGDRYITEFNYRYADTARAHIFVGVGLSGGLAERAQIDALVAEIEQPDGEVKQQFVFCVVRGDMASYLDLANLAAREVRDVLLGRIPWPSGNSLR